jgi:hypothetical protein
MKAVNAISKAGLMMGLAFFLARCGEEGSGNFQIKGSGSTDNSSVASFSLAEEMTEVFADDIGAFAGTANPATLNAKIYEVMVSPNADCSSPTVVTLNVSPTAQDVLATTKPTLAAGNAQGTFKCVILAVSDTIAFTSSTVTGSCGPAVAATKDICTGGANVDFPDNSYFSRGAGAVETTCGAAEQVVPLYFTSLSTSTGGTSAGNFFVAPTSSAQTNGHFVNTISVGTAQTNYLVINATGKVDGSGGTCTMDTPLVSLN